MLRRSMSHRSRLDEHATACVGWLYTGRCLTRFVVQQLGEGAAAPWSNMQQTWTVTARFRSERLRLAFSCLPLVSRLCTVRWECA